MVATHSLDLVAVQDSLAKLKAIYTKLADPETGEFVGKGEIVDVMIVCAIAQEPMIIFGEPGTAKSAIIGRFCDLLGYDQQDYFKYLLTSFTEPDELLGVVDIKAYTEEQKFERISQGSIQKARIVFLDEVFRGNSAILNTLLSIINERIYYEGGVPKQAKTQVVYGATNDAPTSHDLRAFYARFPIRVRSDRVSQMHPEALLEKGWRLEVEELRRRKQPGTTGRRNSAQALCQPEDLERCQDWLHEYWAPNEQHTWGDPHSSLAAVKTAYFQAIQKMNESHEQFQIDDRKAVKLFKLILAHAMLHSGPESIPTLNDLWAVLRHTWQDPELANLSRENVWRLISEISTTGELPDALRLHAPEENLQ